MTKPQPIALSWSSGKDSAWTLYQLQQDPNYEVISLFTSINKTADRVAMHAVRRELLNRQAEAVGLPIDIIELPFPCSNEDYEEIMTAFVKKLTDRGLTTVAFGDLFLEDVRDYRINQLKNTGLTPIFPIWGTPTSELSQTLIAAGVRTHLTCLDPKKMPTELAGSLYNQDFLNQLPETVDPCGENGEFHTFVSDGPMFNHPLQITMGETVTRDGFVFTDILPG